MKRKIIIFSLMLCSSSLFAQWNTNGNFALPTDYLGTNNNQPLVIKTAGTERMRIRPNFGGLSGFVGINEPNPIFRLHVKATTQATSQGWKRGILISDQGLLMWHGAPNTNNC